MRRAKMTALSIYREAEAATDRDKQKKLASWALSSQNENRLKAMVNLSKSEPGVTILADELDADLYLLNCANGTLDLHTGDVRDHEKADLITMITPIVFDPGATFDRWSDFLAAAVPNEQVRSFMQLAAGYTLLGRAGADVLMLILGPARSGKGTYQQSLAAALGDYAITAGLEDFAHRKSQGGARPELVRLRGSRLVNIYETSGSIRLSTSWLKTLTGGDPVTARDLYSRPITFVPQFTIYIATNHPPRLPADDHAIWERMRRLSFDQVVPEAKRDPGLRADLSDPKVGGPAVLAWAVDGCRRYLNQPIQGLLAPATVKAAGEKLRQDQDHFADFAAESLIFGDDLWVTAESLRAEYLRWCDQFGEKPLSAKGVGKHLRDRNCEREKRHVGWCWVRVGLKGPCSESPTNRAEA